MGIRDAETREADVNCDDMVKELVEVFQLLEKLVVGVGVQALRTVS